MTINPSKAKSRPVEVVCAQYIPGVYTRREWQEFCPKVNIGTKVPVQDENSWEAALDQVDFVWFSVETALGAQEVLDGDWVLKVGDDWQVLTEETFLQTMILTEVEGVQVILFDHNVIK